ncbi:MAG: hypothetical protein KC621_30910, partial [Myxococcales bacterium]|nr:hypothetical protein [Myxococcales bacterium]
HKLPTGIPVRRIWLGLVVTDGSGAEVVRLGGIDAEGRLVGADGAVLPSELAGGPIVGHLDRVTEDDVQVWEGVLADGDGRPTWLLMRAEGWAKDDRLLPSGFEPRSAEGARVLPVGTGGDADFGPGADTVHVDLDLAGASGPFEVRATVWFQPLSARWAAELEASGTPEALALGAMVRSVGNAPEVVATASVNVP